MEVLEMLKVNYCVLGLDGIFIFIFCFFGIV